jgi:hypothetical protein
MKYKYGEFTENQISLTKAKLRKQIFFLLLIVDPDTRTEYEDTDPVAAIENVQWIIGGFNELFDYPQEIVTIASLLSSALIEYTSPKFDYKVYRKLILDAGNEVLKIKEV